MCKRDRWILSILILCCLLLSFADPILAKDSVSPQSYGMEVLDYTKQKQSKPALFPWLEWDSYAYIAEYYKTLTFMNDWEFDRTVTSYTPVTNSGTLLIRYEIIKYYYKVW